MKVKNIPKCESLQFAWFCFALFSVCINNSTFLHLVYILGALREIESMSHLVILNTVFSLYKGRSGSGGGGGGGRKVAY